MKTKPFIFLALAALFGCKGQHDTGHMDGKDIAVFYPAGYDSSQHEPSPIFVRDFESTGRVDDSWTIRPEFTTTADGKSVARIPIGEDVDLYGTGEVTGPLRRNGQQIVFWNTDNPAYGTEDGKRLYQTHPWVMGVRPDGSAFGVIADNTWKSTLTLNDDILFESEGPAFRVIVIEKDTPQELLSELADLTGHMEMPPLWALGYQQCRFSYNPDSRVKEIADSLRLLRIPSDVIWMDIDYMDSFKIFTFDPQQFPDPKALNDYLHARNFKAVYMIDPGVKVQEGYFVDDQGSAAGYWVKDSVGNPFVGDVWPGACHFPDFTRPEVRSWWSGLYKDFMATGIDGVWNDMNEPAVFGAKVTTMPDNNQHGGGDGTTVGPHLRYHNAFGYNMVKATREGILAANPDKRPFVLTRANLLGGQRYAATWTGDNGSDTSFMNMSIPMSINLGLSGQPFNGPDLGGFCNSCNPDLLAQWSAMGVFFPFVRNHSCKGTANQEPWAMGKQTLEVYRTAVNRRYMLLPYIYTLFREAHESGQPVMRPTFFADITDPALRSEDQTFLLGGDLMIVPRQAKSPAMPAGDWKQILLETTPDDGYQAILYQRPGSVIPVAELSQSTAEYDPDRLTLFVNLDADGNAGGRIYEDDGDGFEFRDGAYIDYMASARTDDDKVIVSLEKKGGLRDAAEKQMRIGLVTPDGIRYSPWTKGLSVSMPK